jgi:hypothetical protein
LPQPPQFRLSVEGLMHSLWQRRSPATQLPTQTPAPPQTFPPEQTLPQVPQLAESPFKFAQYVPRPLPQRTWGLAQVAAQAPYEQTCPAAHALPQAPQFWLSIEGLMHWPWQVVNPDWQVIWHLPAPLQTVPAGQTLPQLPQLVGSAFRFAQ